MTTVTRTCLLGNACTTSVGDVCKEAGCQWSEPIASVPVTPVSLDHSRGPVWWDSHFMDKCKQAARASRDPSTKCGAVIVRPDKTVCSEGFNGFPMGMDDDPALYASRDEKLDRVLHAEENALIFARERVNGYTMYITLLPCTHCALVVIQSGIKRLVAPPLSSAPERWQAQLGKAIGFMTQCGVQVDEFVGMN